MQTGTVVPVEVIVHRGDAPRWPLRVQVLHWLGVLLILSVAVIGLTMGEFERGSEARRLAYLAHKSLGITVLALALLRVLVRATGRAPAATQVGAMHRLAQATHLLMYVLMFAVPLSGWLLNSVAGQPLPWFGLFEIPALVAKNSGWRGPVDAAHEWFFWTLATLVALHVVAAMLHQWLPGDGTLARMLPGRRG